MKKTKVKKANNIDELVDNIGKHVKQGVDDQLTKIENSVDMLVARKKAQVESQPPSEPVKEFKAVVPDPKPEETHSLDMLEEQLDAGSTTRWSKDAEFDMRKVAEHPEQYIEINLIKKSRVVDTFFIFADKATFTYKDKKYNINEEGVYLLPKKGFFIPTAFYYQNKTDPVGFKETNKGITGKALTLLYKHRLYELLLRVEDNSYNIFVIILSIVTLIVFAVALYFMFGYTPDPAGGGGVIPY